MTSSPPGITQDVHLDQAPARMTRRLRPQPNDQRLKAAQDGPKTYADRQMLVSRVAARGQREAVAEIVRKTVSTVIDC